MSNIPKINLTRQTNLNKTNISEIASILDDGDAALYRKENETIGLALKENGVVVDLNPSNDIIKNLPIPDLPNDFPPDGFAYALSAARQGFGFRLVWALVETVENYNE
jgi:hypothetical protein